MKDDDEEKKKKRQREWWEEFLYNVLMQTARQMMEQAAYETVYEELQDYLDEEQVIDIIL